MDIGRCEKCQGHLCMSGKDVACERCGHLHPNHPILKVPPTQPAAQPMREAVIPPLEHVPQWGQAIAQLQQQVKALTARVAELEKVKSRKEMART